MINGHNASVSPADDNTANIASTNLTPAGVGVETPCACHPTTITVICCVCKKFLYTVDGKGIYGLSHGYCDSCMEKVKAEWEEWRQKQCATR
jgi:hypothetical protein